MDLLISLLYLILHIAIILLVAALLVWGLRWMGVAIDATVFKLGQIIVGLLILIAVVAWLAGLAGYDYWPPFFRRSLP